MKSCWRLFLVVFIYVGFVSCEKDIGPILIKPVVPGQPVDTMISFENDIQPYFNARCVGCHDAWHPFLDLRDSISYKQLLSDGYNAPYVNVNDPPQSYLIKRLLGDGYPIMPPMPPTLGQGKIDTILTWIRQGAKYN